MTNFQVGDVVSPNGFTLLAEVTSVEVTAENTLVTAVWLHDKRGSGSLHARKGRATRFHVDTYGNSGYYKI